MSFIRLPLATGCSPDSIAAICRLALDGGAVKRFSICYWTGAAVLTTWLSACAPLPVEPVAENLDTNTGTTVAQLPKPIELLAEAGHGPSRDPYAYLAPFETNRMGQRARYLWISAPQDSGPLSRPQVMCDNRPLELAPVSGELKEFGISRAPYSMPTPWSGQWYFRLSDEALSCMASAKRIVVVSQRKAGEEERYATNPQRSKELAAFALRVAVSN
jgi:hypothetical protein